jgi:hypothetical protein
MLGQHSTTQRSGGVLGALTSHCLLHQLQTLPGSHSAQHPEAAAPV